MSVLYKALAADFRSDDAPDAWVKNEWKEITGALHYDPNRASSATTNGLRCSNDVMIALESGGKVAYLCKAEAEGNSVIPRQTRKGENIVSDDRVQFWQRMRVTNIWAWPKSEVEALALEANWLTYDVFENNYPAEAAAWQAAMDADDFATAVAIATALWWTIWDARKKAGFSERVLMAVDVARTAAAICAADAAYGGGGLARMATAVCRYVGPNETDPPNSGCWEPLHLYVQARLQILQEL
jgi:hypothetical protein